MKSWCRLLLDIYILLSLTWLGTQSRRHRSVDRPDIENNPITNSLDFIWATTTVAVGDTAVLHCSFDAIFSQLRNGNIDWFRESQGTREGSEPESEIIAEGKKVVLDDRRFRVFRPHNSALSVLIIRRAKKRDAGIFRCNLAGSSTRHKYMILNVTESKIEAQTSPAKLKVRVGKDVTLWCNATGYPKPVVYWTREDRNRKLPDGSYQYWGNGLGVEQASEADTGIYACYLDNFVQPVVSYKFTLMVEDSPWNVEAYKMRFDSAQWYPASSPIPKPVKSKSYLLMCETRGSPKPSPRVLWYRDGKRVRNNKHFYIIEDRPEWRSSYASSTLVIMRFVPRFQGNYTCVASNVFRMKKQIFYMHGYYEADDVENPTTTEAALLPPSHLSPPVDASIHSNIIPIASKQEPPRLPIRTRPRLQRRKGKKGRKAHTRDEDDEDEDEAVGRDVVEQVVGPTDDEDLEEGSASGSEEATRED